MNKQTVDNAVTALNAAAKSARKAGIEVRLSVHPTSGEIENPTMHATPAADRDADQQRERAQAVRKAAEECNKLRTSARKTVGLEVAFAIEGGDVVTREPLIRL